MKKTLPILFETCLLLSIALSGCSNKSSQSNSEPQTSSSISSIISPTVEENPQGLDFYLTDNGEYYVGQGQATLLSSITIPSSFRNRAVVGIIKSGFSLCFAKQIVLPETLKYIEDNAFYDCKSLLSLNIPDGVVSIGDSAFAGCDSLLFKSENFCTYIGNEGNPYVVLTKAVSGSASPSFINNNCRLIYRYAFYHGFSSIIIPNNVRTISRYAFDGCDATTVFIPKSVTRIESQAFRSCSNLTIYCEVENKPNGWADDWNYYCPVVWSATP